MFRPFQVQKEEIERLTPSSFPDLMKKILRTELTVLKLKQAGLVLSMDINDPDGGLDAYIGNEIPEGHPWIPSGKSGWQFKAQSGFSVAEVTNEVVNSEKNALKPEIKKILDAQGTYVLVFGGKDYVPADLKEREERLAETISSMGYPEGKSKILSSGQIADWASSLPPVVAYLQPERENFKDFLEWQKSIVANRVFVPDSARQKAILGVRQAIIDNQNKDSATIIRLVGLSGVGKTRLAYECINADNLREIVLYLESPEKLPPSRFNVIAQNDEVRVILVIDECPHNKFVELAREAESIGGRMTLISLDYDIDQPRPAQDKHIILDPLDQAASEELIKKTVPDLPENARKKIAEYSEGFPLILIRLSLNFNLQPEFLSPTSLASLGINDILNKIIAGRGESAFELGEIRTTLTAISLFKRLGWDEELNGQGQKVCELHGIDWMKARLIVEEQERRKLVVKRGRYRYVTPLPLAINLASTWLSSMDTATVEGYFGNLPDVETKKAFLERLADFGYTEFAKEISRGFLSSFDFKSLDTSIGSEIFLTLSKTDHKYSMEVLETALSSIPRDRLLNFKAGRRNIIWTLEKIAWWPDTFHWAARLLLKLADAENETWSNNATGIFAQLFQTFLGGTSVPAWERHSVLEEALDSGIKSLQNIALKGLNAAFNLQHATRNMIAEEQGTVILPPEWNPKTREDLRKSVSSALTLLDKAMKLSDSEIQSEAIKVFLYHVRILLAHGFTEEIMARLESTRTQSPESEKELIKTVESVIHYDSKRLPKEITERVRDFREKLIGNEFDGLMKRYVKSALLEDQLEENREAVAKVLRKLVDASIESPEKLRNELAWLVTNEAENGYAFGQILGESDKDYYWLDIIFKALKEAENPSVFFLGGYLFAVKSRNEDLWEETLYKCHEDEILKKFLLEIIWRSGTSDKAVELIIKMLKNQEIEPQKIRLFTYGAWFNKVSKENFTEFLEIYYKIEDGKYAPTLLGIIQQYVDAHPHFIDQAKTIMLAYLTQHEIFSSSQDVMTMYYWDNLSNKLMDRFGDTLPRFLDLVLDILAKNHDANVEPYFRKKLEYSLKNDAENTWQKVSKALLAHDRRAFTLIHLIKDDHSLIGLIPEAKLWEWVKENPKQALYVLARMIPLHESEPLLHPFARKLLLEYPSDEDIASELSANWYEETGVGSISQRYEQKLSIAEKWAEDPETPVANWARREVEDLKKQIEDARRQEAEGGF
jgi:hypothetical protein